MGLFKNKMRDPVEGRAEVVEVSGEISGAGIPGMRLILTADGVPPTPVNFRGGVSQRNRLPDIGDSIPVTVDRANPQVFSINLSELPTRAERNAADAQQRETKRLEEMRGEAQPGGDADDDVEEARQMWRENLEKGYCTQEEFDKEMRELDEA